MPGVPNDGPLVIDAEAALGDELVFVATNPSGQQQLFVTDGSVAGTQALTAGNGALTNFRDFTVVGSRVYFEASAPGSQPQLFSTDGTPGLVLQYLPFNASGGVGYTVPYDGSLYFTDTSTTYGPGVYSTSGTSSTYDGPLMVNTQPVNLNGKLLFEGYTSQFGAGLYLSDGNPADLTAPIPLPGNGSPGDVFTVSGNLAFFTSSPAGATLGGGVELWVTNGTSAGRLVAPFQPSDVTPFDGGVIFTGNGGPHQSQVWFSNGGTASELYIDQQLDHTPSLGPVTAAASFDGKAFFVADNELYSTDGTTAGTTDIGPFNLAITGPNTGTDTLLTLGAHLVGIGGYGFDSMISTDGTAAGSVVLSTDVTGNGDPTIVDGKLFVITAFNVTGTDGTAAGTSAVFNHSATSIAAAGGLLLMYFGGDTTSAAPGLYAYNPTTQSLTTVTTEQVAQFGPAIGAKELFVGTDLTNGNQLWVTDGTAAGTQMINLNASIVGQVRSIDPEHLTLDNGLIYFDSRSVDGSQSPALTGLWATDGTAAGTHMVSSGDGNGVAFITAAGTDVLFQTGSGFAPILWDYDTVHGTTTEIGPSAPLAPFIAGSNDFFLADPNQDLHLQLEIANPGGGATVLTTATNGGVTLGGQTYLYTAVGSKLFFVGDDSVHGQGLFVSDGTVAGTQFLAAIPTGFSDWSFNAVGNDLYFENNDPANGDELWVSDGTVAGTHRVTDTAVNQSANASGYTVMGSRVYFSATDGIHGQELWSFSGSGSATMVADINPGAASSDPADLTVLGSTLYFTATAADGSSEVWSTTGSGATEVSSPTNGAGAADLTAVGSELFFYGDDATHGAGLFVSDGTAASTTFVGAFAQVSSLYAVGTELYFNADTDQGWQLWKTNGAPGGTQQLTFAQLASDDFNADAKSDFLIQNGSGVVVVGEVTNGAASYAGVAALGPEWSFKGDGDFMGDQTAGFLIENTAGAVVVGEVSGGATTYALVAALGSEWSFQGVGDFLGAGRDQFLIENTAGAVVVGEVVNGQASYTVVGALGPEWSFHGAGDFLGDGQDQFLIENTAGAVVIGNVQGGAASYTAVAGLGPEWKFVGTGDFLGDGKDDFLIENTAGAVVAGEVTNGQASYTQLTGLGPEWKFVGAGDYLGEGHDQFLIENTAGAVVIGDWTGGAIHFTLVAALGPEWAFH